MTGPTAVTVFVAALVAAVLLHELGHLVTAKRFGMRADRYFVGFGPTLWSTRVGETVYGVKLLPLGGFVRVMGMAEGDERLAPVGATVAAALGRSRASGVDPAALAAVLDEELGRRGAGAAVRAAVADALRARLADGADDLDLATAIDGAAAAVVGAPARVGDLAHRLLLGDEGRHFADRPAWQRAVVLATGPLTHLVIAFAVLAGTYLLLPQPTGEVDPVVAAVQPGSPAEAAGVRPGDRVVAVGDVASDDFAVLREAIRARPGVPTTLELEREGQQRTVTVTPAPADDAGTTVGVAGFAPEPAFAALAPGEALARAVVGEPSAISPGGIVPMLSGSAVGLVRIFSPQGLTALAEQAVGEQERDVEGAVSLVGAASVAGQIAGAGPYGLTAFLALLAAINVFFLLFNLVPLPPFDGGHLAVLGVERAVNAVRARRGRPADYRVDPRSVSAVAVPVIGVLGFVLLATLWLDLTTPLRLG